MFIYSHSLGNQEPDNLESVDEDDPMGDFKFFYGNDFNMSAYEDSMNDVNDEGEEEEDKEEDEAWEDEEGDEDGGDDADDDEGDQGGVLPKRTRKMRRKNVRRKLVKIMQRERAQLQKPGLPSMHCAASSSLPRPLSTPFMGKRICRLKFACLLMPLGNYMPNILQTWKQNQRDTWECWLGQPTVPMDPPGTRPSP